MRHNAWLWVLVRSYDDALTNRCSAFHCALHSALYRPTRSLRRRRQRSSYRGEALYGKTPSPRQETLVRAFFEIIRTGFFGTIQMMLFYEYTPQQKRNPGEGPFRAGTLVNYRLTIHAKGLSASLECALQ